jgi:hypothetical protein
MPNITMKLTNSIDRLEKLIMKRASMRVQLMLLYSIRKKLQAQEDETQSALHEVFNLQEKNARLKSQINQKKP